MKKSGFSKKKQPRSIADQILNSPTAHMYKRISFGFVVLVSILLVTVVYISTVQAVIGITPVAQELNTDFVLDIVPSPSRTSEVRGTVIARDVTDSETFTPSGDSVEHDGIARGEATVFNTHTRNQSLVKTTRFLSSDGILFRLASPTTIPSGSDKTVELYADVVGKTGDIGASRFSIPGLPPVLQEKIYAVSENAFSGGRVAEAVLRQDEIDAAVLTLKESVYTQATESLHSEATLFDGELYQTSITQQSVSEAAGSKASSYEVKMDLSVVGVFYDKPTLVSIAHTQLANELSAGTQLLPLRQEDIVVTIERYDIGSRRANVRVSVAGRSIPSNTSDALDPGRFVGKSAQEVVDLLTTEGIATDVTVQFFPFWISKVPRLTDHILIDIL